MRALFDAIASGDLVSLRAALQDGLDPNRDCEGEGESLLHRAAFCGNQEAVELLAQHGAELDRSCNGFTALHLACMESEMGDEYMGAAETLLEFGASVDARSETGYTALFYAAGVGNAALVTLLLDAGADLTATSERGWSALHEAAEEDETGAGVTALLNRGADPDAVTDDGETPAHRAAPKAFGAPVMTLLARMRHPDAMAAGGFGLIHAAALGGLRDAVDWLLSHGVSAALRTSDGLTPLHYAASYVGAHDSSPDVVRLLLAHGADPDAVDEQGRTPADLAFNRDEYETILSSARRT